MISKSTTHFKTSCCSYTINKYKENAARSILYRRFKIPFSYTLETSYGVGDANQTLTILDFVGIGRAIASATCNFMKYLNAREDTFPLQASESDEVKYCHRVMAEIRQSKKEVGIEIDSSDSEEDIGIKATNSLHCTKPQKTFKDLKLNSKKVLLGKIIQHKRLRRE